MKRDRKKKRTVNRCIQIKSRKEQEKGSITVEMAFVFPMVFFLVLTLCYLTFFMCDKVRLQSMVNTLSEKQAVCVKDHYELGSTRDYSTILEKGVLYYLEDLSAEQALFQEKLENKGKKLLILGEVESVECSVGYSSVEANIVVNVEIGLSMVKEYFTGTPLQYTIHAKIPVHNPSEFVRSYTVIGDTIDQIEGASAIKEKLRNLLGYKEEME